MLSRDDGEGGSNVYLPPATVAIGLSPRLCSSSDCYRPYMCSPVSFDPVKTVTPAHEGSDGYTGLTAMLSCASCVFSGSVVSPAKNKSINLLK